MTEITARRQTVNFLGFLRGQLSGLQGIPTLCYELIQNADDVKDSQGNPGASKIIFDVCDDALNVYNNGVFREIDFERMEKISWGNKREEVGTTGAFGLGFISVYQITDSPEIFSSGRHWIFNPNGPEDERILETREETNETKFRLPWAFEETDVRKELGIPPISPNSLDTIVTEINHAIESAALFLKQVNHLELRRNGNRVRSIETIKEQNKLLLVDGDQTVIWQILEGEFNNSANEIRREYRGVIEDKRQAVVKLAIPDEPTKSGLLYAFLPSETKTQLPFHINADFYPSPDRKRIIFDGSYKSAWNEAALSCAAELLSRNIETLLAIFPNQQFWEFIESIQEASKNVSITSEMERFWELLLPEISNHKTVLTSRKERCYPNNVKYLDTNELLVCQYIFESLGLPIADPVIRKYQNLLLTSGVKRIQIQDICKLFLDHQLNQRIPLENMPHCIRTKEDWKVLFTAMDHLYFRNDSHIDHECESHLKSIAIAFGSDGALWPPKELFSADESTISFFSKISDTVWYEKQTNQEKFLEDLVPEFSIDDGLFCFEKSQEIMQDLWEEGDFSPVEMLGWFEENRFAFRDQRLLSRLRGLSIWPSSEGVLKPIKELFLVGDFEDPLHLAQLIDLDAIGGSRDFITQTLDITRLDFLTYVSDWLPSIFQEKTLSNEERIKLVEILSENQGKIKGNQQIRNELAKLPIILCQDGEFHPAMDAWSDTSIVREVLGNEIPLAAPPQNKADAIKDFYLWIGVSPEPEPKDIVKRIKSLVEDAPNENNNTEIGKLINYISTKWAYWDETEKELFSILQNYEWLPGNKDKTKWFLPCDVNSIYSAHLFESQGNFLEVERRTQQNANEFFKYLNIESEPDPVQVVRHLLYSSKTDKPITSEIYVYLTRNLPDLPIHLLSGQKCLFINDIEGNGLYYSPNQVFWDKHRFGNFRYRLSADFGRFKPLFDAIGVKEQPDVNDAISVLLEISEKYEPALPIPEDSSDEDILITCWQIISDAFEEDEIEEVEIKQKLGRTKTILNDQRLLVRPDLMFFEDRPGWGEKFKVVRNNLTPRIEGAWLGMQAAGVRALSSVIRTEMTTCDNRIENVDFQITLQDRKNLLQRIIAEHQKQGIKNLEIEELSNLTFYNVDHLEVQRIFTGFGKQETSDIEEVDSIVLDQSLYFVTTNNIYPWKGIARELSFVINNTGELRSMTMELKEIFSLSIDEATSTLDELGYAYIEESDVQYTDGDTLVFTEPDDEELVSIRVGIDFPDAGKTTSTPPASKDKSKNKNVSGGMPATPGKQPDKRKSSRLRSYVYPKDTLSTKEFDTSLSTKRNEVAQKGVDKVLEFEKLFQRTAIDMETIQTHHPSYDIESTDSSNEVRYIEVKTLSGIWDSQNPVELTKTEFETAKKKGDQYWIYVVEKVDSDNYQIHQIQNPANRVDYYLFDHGWIVQE